MCGGVAAAGSRRSSWEQEEEQEEQEEESDGEIFGARWMDDSGSARRPVLVVTENREGGGRDTFR